MRRALLALTLCLLAAGCGASTDSTPLSDEGAAPPQEARLGWEESYGKPGSRLVFQVDSLSVLDDGWRAEVSVRNDSDARFTVGSGPSSLEREFGLMLLPTGDVRELDRLNRAGELPAVRPAMAAQGALPGGGWARVVFGVFLAIEEPPKGMQERVIWITDHAHRLRPGPQQVSEENSGSSASEAKSESPAAMSR
jgi:hypothetical protein